MNHSSSSSRQDVAVVIRSKNILIDGEFVPRDIWIDNEGTIVDITALGQANQSLDVVAIEDHDNQHVMPGLVDTHVHFNQPGRSDWEGVLTGTQAARAGGYTTVFDMPLNSSPVTTTPQAVQQKVQSVQDQLLTDFGVHGGLIPANKEHIGGLIDSGVSAIKAFLCPSGIDEFPHVERQDLLDAMVVIAQSGTVLMVHAEVQSNAPPLEDQRSYHHYMRSRPPEFERAAIEMMIDLVRQTACPVHIVHLADAGSLAMLVDARQEGLPITVETCPHYLTLAAEEIADGSTSHKCAPPIRDKANQDGLWQGLLDGTIDMINSDHSPCPPDMKDIRHGRFDHAWGGIASIQVGFPVIWTEASKRGIALSKVHQWMSDQPARLVQLPTGVKVGQPANVFAFDPDHEWTIEANELFHRHPVTPYDQRRVRGKVLNTYLCGQKDAAAGQGRVLTRNDGVLS